MIFITGDDLLCLPAGVEPGILLGVQHWAAVSGSQKGTHPIAWWNQEMQTSITHQMHTFSVPSR